MRRLLLLPCVWLLLSTTHAQTAPPATQPATQPTTQAAGRTPVMAQVIELRGDVRHAPLGSDEYQPCALHDAYPDRTVILTGIRSSVKLRVGTDDTHTLVVIEPASKTLIAKAYITRDTKRVNIGVGYGRIRAGVVEGGLKSDFTIDSPVATLSKRGTWDFGLFYERDTDRFEIFLHDRGMVDAFNRITGETRRLLPNEWVNQTMRRWADQAELTRNVAVPDFLGQGDIEVAFNNLQQSGLRVLNPEGGQVVLLDLSSSAAQAEFARIARRNLTQSILTPGFNPQSRLRAEGFFGTGRGDQLIPLIVGKDSDLSRRGFARPGRYLFRQSALQNWLRQHQSH